jgi:hypothetical protein
MRRDLGWVLFWAALLTAWTCAWGAHTAASGATLADYTADTLPQPPWEFINNGPPEETSQHTVYVQDGVLHLIDTALLTGNTLGYLQYLPFDPQQRIDVQFRARVLSGESTCCPDGRAPFSVWLYNGTIYADLDVGPQSITALGGEPWDEILLINSPLDGTTWHSYAYRVDPIQIRWQVDGTTIGHTTTDNLLPYITDTDRRINMMITSATANVELDYLTVRMTPIIPVVLDIRPGRETNPINPKSTRKLPVAILTTDTLDATSVNAAEVRFGAKGIEAAPVLVGVDDVNHDGRPDLLLHFNTQDTGIRCGDTAAVLTGQTFSEQPIQGSDTIQTLGCNVAAAKR